MNVMGVLLRTCSRVALGSSLHVILTYSGFSLAPLSTGVVLAFSWPILHDRSVFRILRSCTDIADFPLFTALVPFTPISVQGMETIAKMLTM